MESVRDVFIFLIGADPFFSTEIMIVRYMQYSTCMCNQRRGVCRYVNIWSALLY